MSEKLTLSELFALFGRTTDETRWVGSADSEEYLAVVTYLVQRSSARQLDLELGCAGNASDADHNEVDTIAPRPV